MPTTRSDDIERFSVLATTSLRGTLRCIDANGAGIAVVVDGNGVLLDLITDGDVRRALLNSIELSEPIQRVVEYKASINKRRPVTAQVDDPPELLLLLMERMGIHQIPVLDAEGRLKRVLHRNQLSAKPRLPEGHVAVVMAGGFGTRLRPLTDRTPKPMLKVGDRPILEHIVRRLVHAGIERIYITVHYKPEVITEHFGDGRRFGVNISYIREDVPLGTAGSVARVDHGGRDLLVMNGDVMSELNIKAAYDFHKQSDSLITMAAAPYEVGVPYGVVEVNGTKVTALEEKPVKRFFINTGIYVLAPEACSLIPTAKFFNMTDLIERAMHLGRAVNIYAMHEYWRDIGRLEDLQRVNMEMQSMDRVNR